MSEIQIIQVYTVYFPWCTYHISSMDDDISGTFPTTTHLKPTSLAHAKCQVFHLYVCQVGHGLVGPDGMSEASSRKFAPEKWMAKEDDPASFWVVSAYSRVFFYRGSSPLNHGATVENDGFYISSTMFLWWCFLGGTFRHMFFNHSDVLLEHFKCCV